VFTGYDWDYLSNGGTFTDVAWHDYDVPNTRFATNPMKFTAGNHSNLAVSFLGTNIPANTPGPEALRIALDALFNHANTGPFFARQMIQRLVTSNPSPAYIERVAQVFDAPNGNLGDVVKAILMDEEARHPPALAAGDSYGKLREPILRLTAMWRAFNAQAQPPDAYGEVKMTANNSLTGSFGQGPLESPTVFNFYEPDYQQPGPLADGDRYSPELQILSEASTYSTANYYYNFSAKAYQGMSNPPTDRPLINLSSLTANASNPAAMVATIDRSLLYGTMSASMKSTLIGMLTNLNGASAAEKAWSAIYLAMLSPEFATQRCGDRR
jgi:uncharacterized protein (DUF1800 family)